MRRKFSRILCILLAVLMVTSMMSTAALAAEAEVPAAPIQETAAATE